MTRKILCPVDFSPSSQHAMRVAVRLANEHDAKLVLAHAAPAPGFVLGGETIAYEVAVAAEETELAAAARDATRLGAKRVSTRLVTGTPWQQICGLLEADVDFDLVVMGTHGVTGFRRILLGSVAEQVVRHARCSVLAVRGRDGPHEFRHVLCPTDLSATSRPAVERAAELAARDGLGITLLHVLEVPPADAAEPEPAGVLEEWAAALRAQVVVPVVARLSSGRPAAQALTELDSDVTYDLVVVGSHGRTGVGRILLGSVAEQLVRHAPCPVLVARAGA